MVGYCDYVHQHYVLSLAANGWLQTFRPCGGRAWWDIAITSTSTSTPSRRRWVVTNTPPISRYHDSTSSTNGVRIRCLLADTRHGGTEMLGTLTTRMHSGSAMGLHIDGVVGTIFVRTPCACGSLQAGHLNYESAQLPMTGAGPSTLRWGTLVTQLEVDGLYDWRELFRLHYN